MLEHRPGLPKRIHWIDDDADGLALSACVLESAGYKVCTSRTGAEGLSHVRSHDHDLLIVDLSLPDMSGLQVLRMLQPQAAGTPFLVVTGYWNASVERLALSLGARRTISKPLFGDDLVRQVTEASENSPSCLHPPDPPDVVSVRVGPGTVLGGQDAAVRTVHVIRRGAVKLVRRHPDGRETITGFRYRNGSVGVTSAVCGVAAPDTAICASECLLASASLRAVWPSTSFRSSWLADAASREAQNRAADQARMDLRTPRERLEALLIEMVCNAPQFRPDGSVVIGIPVTQTEIASAVGATRECVNRLLAAFQRENHIRLVRGWLTLPPTSPTLRRVMDLVGFEV